MISAGSTVHAMGETKQACEMWGTYRGYGCADEDFNGTWNCERKYWRPWFALICWGPMRTWWWSVVNALALPELGWEECSFVIVSLIVEEGIQILIFFEKKNPEIGLWRKEWGQLKGRRCESRGRTEGPISRLLFHGAQRTVASHRANNGGCQREETKQEQRTCGDWWKAMNEEESWLGWNQVKAQLSEINRSCNESFSPSMSLLSSICTNMRDVGWK